MAKVDYWLEIDGVEGESHDEALGNDAIQIESWHWGQKNAGSWSINSGGGRGKVEMSDFHFSMWFNKASPKLFMLCATGEHIPHAKLICRKAGGGQQDFVTITFNQVLISSFQTRGGNTSSAQGVEELVHPLNEISFNFETIEVDYHEQGDDGATGATVSAGYDLKKNHKI